MKNLLSIACFLFLGTTGLLGQTLEIEVSNIVCEDDGNYITNLSFDYSLQFDDGTVPHSVDGTGYPFRDENDVFVFNSDFSDDIQGSTSYSDVLSVNNDLVCADILDQTLTLPYLNVFLTEQDAMNFNFTTLPAKGFFGNNIIPTMGQWALMILGLLLTSMAVVVIKKRSAVTE